MTVVVVVSVVVVAVVAEALAVVVVTLVEVVVVTVVVGRVVVTVVVVTVVVAAEVVTVVVVAVVGQSHIYYGMFRNSCNIYDMCNTWSVTLDVCNNPGLSLQLLIYFQKYSLPYQGTSSIYHLLSWHLVWQHKYTVH